MAQTAEQELAGNGVRGLDSADVALRTSEGSVNAVESRTSRSYADIVRANVFTWFNLILGALWVLTVSFGSLKDALFGLVLVLNTAIGVVQEVRAKLTLDRITLISAPKAHVMREGTMREVAVGEVVLGDTVYVEAGEQIVADGELGWSDGLEADQSLLTGESAAVAKSAGDEVMSGSFAVAGRGAYVTTAVGVNARAQRIASRGRAYTRAHSDVMQGINTILKAVGVAMVPAAALAVWAAMRAQGTAAMRVTDIVAALVAMVPEGLVLLSSIAFALSAIALAKRGVLVNELAAVEGLARADVVCADKTGTLTEPQPVFGRFEPVDPAADDAEALQALGALMAGAGAANSTVVAIRDAVPVPTGWSAAASVPFSSARKWSGGSFDDRGTWVLGAPDVLLGKGSKDGGPLLERVRALASEGPRVLMLAKTTAQLPAEGLPPGLAPVGFVLLAEKVREDAAETIRYFGDQGVTVKVISGDSPETVSAIAGLAGVPGAIEAVDSRDLPEGPELADVMERTTVFGRVMPEQKAEMVAALQAKGHTVAMTGDGVNDVLAVKQADLGIAMGSGAAATRAVAQIVLLKSEFSQLPRVMAEGRRVIANAERVANLFVTKTVWATALAAVTGVLAVPYPFLPRQITLVGSLTIGIPSFFLALAPNSRRYRPGLVGRVGRFAIPVGTIVAATVLATFALMRAQHVPLPEARTACSVVLQVMGLGVIASLERPSAGWRMAMLGAMAALFVLTISIPLTRAFFATTLPGIVPMLYALGLSVTGLLGVWRVGRRGGD